MSKVAKLGVYRPHDRVTLDNSLPSKTRQEFAEECDINTIMRRYQKTGVLQHVNNAAPRYMDFSDAPDFHTAMNFMIAASDEFGRLPATVRKRFGNDPAEFVKFAEDPANVEQMRAWGLAAPVEEPPAPQEVRIVGSEKGSVEPANEPGKGSK